jgi:hypothetical protein
MDITGGTVIEFINFSTCFFFLFRKMEEIVSDRGTDSEQVGPTFGNDASGCDLSNEIKKDNRPTEKTDEGEAAHNNPYAYVDRADFTSEKFKIEIRGLPKFYGIGVRFTSLLYIYIYKITCLPSYDMTQM